jgi:hypothetical protein
VSLLQAQSPCPELFEVGNNFFDGCAGGSVCHQGKVQICASCEYNGGQLMDITTNSPITLLESYNAHEQKYFTNIRCVNGDSVILPQYKYAYTKEDPSHVCHGNFYASPDGEHCIMTH